MTNQSLASSYLLKARTRLLVLHLLQKEEAYSDVVREASLYGDIDFIPTEQYGPDAGQRAIDDASFVLDVVTRVVQLPEAP